MPIVYLEVPLLGEPRFDLQVCMDRDALVGGYDLPPEAPAVERPLLEWLTSPAGSDCRGVDLAFDLSTHGAAEPQVIALGRTSTLADAEGFFASAGTPDAARRYREAERRIPAGWRSWYTGLIPGRPGSPVRLDWFVSQRKLAAYTRDTARLSRDLEHVGYHPSQRQLAWCSELLAYPCGLNLQLDAREDGSIGPVLGYNLCMGSMRPRQVGECLEQGWMRQACALMERWGLADGRWQRLQELCLGRALRHPQGAGGTESLALVCKPTFIKVRMTQDALVDAKAYVMCVLSPLGSRPSPDAGANPRPGVAGRD